MLTQLSVKNLAIVSSLELHFSKGMHAITGETGAGKSIIIDALSIALGERAFSEQVRCGEKQAEVVACFDIRNLPNLQKIVENDSECIVRRVINSDGRSRAYINGISATVQQLKELAPFLVQIHSQHEHHALLQSDYQRQIIDVYAGHDNLVQQVYDLYSEWNKTKQKINELNNVQKQSDKLTLLDYQLQELNNLNVQLDELSNLDKRHKQLCNAEEILNACSLANSKLTDDAGIIEQLQNISNKLNNILHVAPQLKSCVDLLQQSSIILDEASGELEAYYSKLDIDPEKLQAIEARLSAIHSLARKLRVEPNQLNLHRQQLQTERDKLANATKHLEQLHSDLIAIHKKYLIAATDLTASRTHAANKLTKSIISRLQQLEMPQTKFSVQIEECKNKNPTMHGLDTISFLVTTNPGQPPALLKKVASGGELSRISLAIQVISSQKMATPTLILDEVDVGISGKTAATVGQIMRELGVHAQIICITHLPQVASQAHIHFKVEKSHSTTETSTKIIPLEHHQRVQELARLLGGVCVTPEALANAEKLLDTV